VVPAKGRLGRLDCAAITAEFSGSFGRRGPLGYMERCLHRMHGHTVQLHVEDYASGALVWLCQELPADCIHTSNGNGIAPTDSILYNTIYLSAVDYALDDQDMIGLLSALRSRLQPGASVLLISASFLVPPATLHRTKDWLKDQAKTVLEAVGLYHRGQFWGWQRTQEEYRAVMHRAGYASVSDGFIETAGACTYYIEGRGSFDLAHSQ
jgi:hypothetical protein